MFAYVVPGRFVQPVAQILDSPERFAAQIPDAEQLNHITVFLTGQAPFPEGYGCTIHLDTPGKGWQLIGGLTNAKPSAIFRLRNTFIPSSSSFSASLTPSGPTSSTTATLGILCEPLASVESQLSSLGQTALGAASNPADSTALVPAKSAGQGADPVALAGLVGKNLFNSVAGFAQPLPDGSQWIPLNTVERWYRDFERKLKTAGVGFLLRSD